MPFDSSNYSLRDHPLGRLPREDLDLVMELVRKSGSLKDLSTTYGVSYPTIRARLDKVLQRLEGILAGRKPDPVAELLATLVERGEITPTAARSIRDAVRQREVGEVGGPGGQTQSTQQKETDHD